MSLPSLADLFSLMALGAALGLFGGLFGIGGGIIAVPVLALGFGMSQALAQGTSLSMMVPILIVGLWKYSRKHPIPLPSAIYAALLASLTTYFVAEFATDLDQDTLRAIFASFLLILGIQMGWKSSGRFSEKPTSIVSPKWMPFVGCFGGGSMGLLGVGGGLVATPMLTYLFGQRQALAQSISMALVTPCAIVALFTYNAADAVDWSVGFPLALGGLATVSRGVSLAHKLPEQKMRSLFSGMLVVTALFLLIKPYVMH